MGRKITRGETRWARKGRWRLGSSARKNDGLIVLRIAFGGRDRVNRFSCGISSGNFLARLLLASFDRIQAFAEPGFFRPMPVLIRIRTCVCLFHRLGVVRASSVPCQPVEF